MTDRNYDDTVYEGSVSDNDQIVVRQAAASEDSQGWTGMNNIASSVREVAQKTGEVINRATETIGKAIDSALAAREHVVMVRVNDDSLKKLDALVQSGIFRSRSEAAAFLIAEGAKAQSDLFHRIEEKIGEIERLRSELKTIVNQ